jgi:hypothetical protein
MLLPMVVVVVGVTEYLVVVKVVVVFEMLVMVLS